MNIATEVVDHLKETLQSIAEVGGKVFHVLSEEEVVALAGVIPFPAIAIVYEGTRAAPESGRSHKMGAAATVAASFVLFYKVTTMMTPAQREVHNRQALEILDRVRKKMLDTVGPSNKTWQFVAEAPAFEKTGIVMWIQRWALPAILL